MSFFHLTSLFWNEGGAYVFYAQSPVPGDCLRWMHSRRDAGAVRDTDTNPRTTGAGDGIQGSTLIEGCVIRSPRRSADRFLPPITR
jgi:hypothetical protein